MFSCAIFAPLIAPYGEAEVVGDRPIEPWSCRASGSAPTSSAATCFSRLIYGARNTHRHRARHHACSPSPSAAALGILAVDLPRLDRPAPVRALVDALMAIPQLIFALMLLSIFGSSIQNLIIIIAVLDSTRVFRLARAVAMNVVVMDYVEAAKLRGERLGWIMFREILPNIMPTAGGGVRPALLLRVPHHQRAVLPRRRHPAADRRLGLDGARERDAHHLWRHHAAAAGRRHRAAHRRRQFRGRLVPAQDERTAR